MQDLFISINKNVARISTLDKDGIKFHTQPLNGNVTKDTVILDSTGLADALDTAIAGLTSTSRSKLRLNFIVSPEDTICKFVTINKHDGDVDAQIVTEIKSKLDGESIDDLYFSYQKIAPFVYQFVGVKKDFLEEYLQVASVLKISLNTVVPWILLLPKYVGTNDSAIFISSVEGNQVVALSELGGVFFTGVFKKQKSTEELNEIIQELSVYKRQKPIQKVYTLNYPLLSLSEGYTIHEIELPNGNVAEAEGFESNLLTNYMLDMDSSLDDTQLNLLNLLPLPAVAKPAPLAKLVVPALAVVVALLGFGGFMFFSSPKTPASDNNLASNTNTEVLGGNTPQSTESVVESTPSLKSSDLKVRVENGSNITGIAAKTKDYLTAKKYVITDIATSDETRTTTLFKFKKGKVDYKTLLSADTKDIFPQISVEDTLPDSAAYDVLIIVGSTVKF